MDEERAILAALIYKSIKKRNVNERLKKFQRMSDGRNIAEYLMVAVEYFEYRCALSGEKFKSFEETVSRRNSNFSLEHIIALSMNGHDIVQNIVPSIGQYNNRKNNYYLLDYWKKQEDINGKKIYSPYRLLKLINYVMKSINTIGEKRINAIPVGEYKKAIMTPNAIDEYLSKVENQDLEETDNYKRKLLSDTITTISDTEDNVKVLTSVPGINNISTEHREKKTNYNGINMLDIFLRDAIGIIENEKEISEATITTKEGNQATIKEELEKMLKEAIGKTSFAIEVRDVILESLKEIRNRKKHIFSSKCNISEFRYIRISKR